MRYKWLWQLVVLSATCNLLVLSKIPDDPKPPRKYCEEECKANPQVGHVMCTFFREEIPGPNCHMYREVELDRADWLQVLDQLNTKRSFVARGRESKGDKGPQPQAANMRLLTWDLELSFIARRWAMQCTELQDDCRDLNGKYYGQLTVTLRDPVQYDFQRFSIIDSVNEWYSQVVNFSALSVNHFESSTDTYYYEQLVRANYDRVGCSRVYYLETEPEEMWCTRLVCNIGAEDNTKGRPLYEEGPPCTSCPKNTTCSTTYPGLCEETHGYLAAKAGAGRVSGGLLMVIVLTFATCVASKLQD